MFSTRTDQEVAHSNVQIHILTHTSNEICYFKQQHKIRPLFNDINGFIDAIKLSIVTECHIELKFPVAL